MSELTNLRELSCLWMLQRRCVLPDRQSPCLRGTCTTHVKQLHGSSDCNMCNKYMEVLQNLVISWMIGNMYSPTYNVKHSSVHLESSPSRESTPPSLMWKPQVAQSETSSSCVCSHSCHTFSRGDPNQMTVVHSVSLFNNNDTCTW